MKKRTRPKDRADSETRLIEAARAVFSEHGYDGATTRMIAERAGLNLALISRYFDNKHGLLIAVIKREAEAFRSSPLSYPKQKSLLDECLKFVETRFHAYVANIDLFRIATVQLITDPEFASQIRQNGLLDSATSIEQRIAPFLKKSSAPKSRLDLRFVAETLERNVLASVIVQHLMRGESQSQCLKALRALTTAYCQSFDLHSRRIRS